MAARGPRAVLVGPMGAGKSTVGALLARRWGVALLDSDAEIERVAGKPVPQIFADDGEPAFRTLEHETVVAALETHAGVLALGGGAVLDPATQAALQGHPVVFLRVGAEAALARVGSGAGRPLLAGDVRERVTSLLTTRTPVYEAVATLVVDTDGRSPAQIVDEIIHRIEEHP